MKRLTGGALLRTRHARACAAVVTVGALCALTWTALAGGQQPNETYQGVISASGPVAQFRFSDAAGSSTIADSAGSYTATNHGITLAEPGPFGGSNSGLFGGEAYAALPGNPLSGASEFTAEAWVDWTGGASYEQPIFDFGSSTTNYMALTPSGGSSHHLRFEIHTSSGTATVESSKALTASEWKYVAVSETSSGTITLYLNGAESAQTTKATLFPSSLGTVSNDWLGKPQGSGTPLFNGHMSNVAFYTKALSAASLLEHYDAAEYPVNTALPTVSGTDLEGDTLTAAAGTWTGLATIKFEYQWERCEGSTCSLITGATKSTYKTVSEDVDHGIRLAVTATNSAGKGNAKSAITSLIEGKPANTTLPSLSGVAEVGRTLHVSSGTWRADPSPTYTYQWELCKEKKCSKISGATESKYKLLSSQAGETVRVTVTATNSVGSASAASAETGSIGKTSCTDEWIGASGGTWQTAANWSTGKVPGSSDYACIEAGESVQVSASGQVAGTIRDEGTLEVLSGAGLELSGKTSTSTVANLSDTGTLAVAGTLDVSGSFTGNGHGTITGAGKVVLLTGSTGAITPVTCSKFYVNGGATLVNDGTITMGSVGGKSSGQLTMTEGAKLENAGTFNLDSYPESCIEGSNRASIENGETGAAPAVTNTGTLNVNVGSANTATISTPLNNQGTLTTQTGTLNLTGGGTSNSGTWTADSATTIAFTSGAPSITGATWAGAGTISIAGATATATTITASTANISITSGSLTIPSGSTTTTGSLAIGSGGVLSSAGTLDVSGSFTGNGHGTITGAGKVVLLTGSTGAITPVTCSKFYVNGGATLVNDGTITMGSVGGKSSGQLTMTEGAKLENAGTFNLDSYPESCIEGSNRASIENGETGAAPAVTNTGTLNVNVGSANTATISTPLNNQGTLTTQTGTLNLTGGGTSNSGTWTADSATTIAFTSGAPSITGATWAGAGTISIAGATATATTITASTANISITSGSLTIPSGSTTTTGSLAIGSGGVLSSAGTLDVSGSFTGNGHGTITGAGKVVLLTGSTGAITPVTCSKFYVNGGATLVNDGTITMGSVGGKSSGQLTMTEGAKLENAGTFNLDSYPESCIEGSNRASIENGETGAAPAVTNTGTLNVNVGSANTATISTPLNNQGTLTTQTGTLNLTGGGTSNSGTWTADSATTIAFTSGAPSITGATWAGAGTISIAGATATATTITASTANISITSGSLTIPSGSTTTTGSLAIGSGGVLSSAGTLDVSGSFTGNGHGTITGAGKVVLLTGSTGAITPVTCSKFYVNGGATLVNDGTITMGSVGGKSSGQLTMTEGAKLENAGTFNLDSYPESCIEGSNRASIENGETGAAPAVTNTGTLNVNVGSANTATISTPLNNQGTLTTQTGTLNLTGGGTSNSGTWTADSATTIAFTSGAPSITGATWAGAGTISIAGATATATTITASTANISITSGSLTIPSGSTTTTGSLAIGSGGVLSSAGTLDVSGSFTGNGHGTITGAGKVVLLTGSTGAITPVTCSKFYVNGGATLVNDGTITMGSVGGKSSGQLTMTEGAKLENAGTFNLDSYPESCIEGSNRASIENGETGAAPAVTNTGTLNVNVGSANTATISTPLNNQGTLTTQTGTLNLTGGSSTEVISSGSWLAGGGHIGLTSGTFNLREGSAFEANAEGGVIIWFSTLQGGLEALPYASGTVTVQGHGEGGLAATLTVTGTVEIAQAGKSEWHNLCESLSGAGTFSCTWNTASGSYPDGSYELRAKLSSASPAESTTTTPITVLVDNTAPTGAVTAPAHEVGGYPTVSGTATDSGSGVASWQLRVAAHESSEWSNACPSQTAPASGSTYSCTLNATALHEGAYQLDAVVTDKAGNTFTTPAVAMQINNAKVSATLTTPPAYLSKTASLTGKATATGSSIASWTVQIATPESNTWSNACPTQTSPIHESEYGCTMTTTAFADGQYEMRVLALDTAGDSYTSTPLSATIDNTPPTGNLYQLPPSVAGSLEVSGYAYDAGSGVNTWTLERALVGSGEFKTACTMLTDPLIAFTYSCTISTTELTNGEYQFRAKIVDNAGNSYTTPVVSTTVANGTLSNTTAPTVSGETTSGSALTTSNGKWSGGGTITYRYQWERCNASGAECVAIESATAASYVLASADVGHTLRVTVTAANGAETKPATSTVTAAVTNPVLHDVTVPSVHGYAQVGAVLSAETGSWRGVPPIAYAYQWQRCSEGGTGCANISAATSQTYVPVQEDASHTLRVVVTATNSEGSSSAESALTKVVAAGTTTGIRYLYEEAGRLKLVDSPTEGAAVYSWDPNGNLLSIQRFAATTLSVLAATPKHAPSGAKVDLTGTDFDTNPAHDSVTFNEVSATIASVTPTDITVTVPSGFTSGTITVTVDGKSAKLGGTFEGDARRAEGRAAIATRSANTTHAAATQAAHAALATHATSSRSLQATLATYRSPYPSTWTPAARNTRFGDWFSERAPSPWTKLGPLSAPHGTTGLTGQVLDVDGTPLTHVTLSIEGFPGRTQTDSTGRFVLDGIPGGHQVLVIDGASANRTGADYGRFTAAVEVQAGKLTPLGYPVWLTPLDPAGDSTIESPLKHETALTNPSIPGLEVRLPAGTVVRSASGAAVRHVNLTAIPLDRTPFPLPPFITGVPTYFTVQPGGAYLNKGAQIVYPNWGHLPAGQRVDFWNYNPHDHGWYVYGKGTVSANGKQVVPDPGVRVWEFTGAMLSTGGTPPGEGPPAGSGAGGGDPVDDATGLFVWQHTDLSVPDANLPISLTQVYRPGDPTSYSFGIGTQSVYDIHIWGAENYRLAYVVLPDGGTVKLVRTSPGSGYTEAVYTAEGAPGYWQGTQLYWNTGAGGWVLRLKTGLKYYFPDYAPASSIEAPDGERVVLSREGGVDGRIREIRGPHNRSIFLNYDSSNRVIRATDSGGQTVHYEYNAAGLLARVTDALGHVTRYAYNSANEMTSVTNARGNVLVANTYNASGEVVSQTVGGKGTYTFKRTWPCGECKAKGTSILTTTNPVGEKRVIYFNDWLAASETFDPGPSAQWRDYQRGANGEVTKITSSEGTTAYTYNTAGYPTSETRYSATQAPLTTTRVYNEFGEPTSVTDPMGRTTVYRYDEHGNLISKTDPLGNTTTFGRGTDGELTSITNAEGQTTRYRYTNGERTGVTDPLGHEWEIGYNAAGDATSVRDPEGDVTKFAYDADNELLSETDGANDTTSYEYDADGDIIAITDPRKNVQKATYNALDQLESVTDALKRTTTYEHNAIGQLTAVTDPEGKTSTFAYDGLGRLEESAYGIVSKGKPTSTTSYSYNPENELSTVKDSRAGTFTFTYDGFHRLAGESGPNGSVAYTYNPDGQRETMSLNGTEEASYAYNAGGQLTAIKTPNGTTSFNLNANGQRTLTTLSNGDTESYGYDGDSRLSSVNYANSKGARIGDLELGRDALGRVTTESGSEARTTLPAALAEATYDADNEILTREGKKFTYNLDGDLTEDNLGTYSWNDRNQLTGVKQGANSWTYSYDPFGRRMSTTVGSTETSYLDAGLSPARETTSGQATQLLDGLGLNEVFARTSSTTSSLLDTAPGGSEAGTGAAFSPPGNTLALTNAEGATTTEYTYDPFGAATSSGTSSPNTVQYDGGEEEADGLEFDRARYYQPQTARFISNDPIGFDGSGINLYGFVHDDPTNLRDPLGLFPEKTYNPTETCEKDECSQLHELAEEEGEKVGGGPVNAAAPKGHGKEVEEDICTIKSIVKTIVDTPEGIVEIAKEVISASKC